MVSSLLLLVLISFSVHSQIADFPFQKKVWTYWHEDDFSTAPMLVRQCSQQIKNQAQKAGLEYFLLSKSTVRQYITNFDQKITKIRQKSKQYGLTYEADLIRFHLILQNGGIWIDITTALPQGLDWLINIKSEKYRNIITNRFSQEPDALICYFEGYQNINQYRIDYKPQNPMQRSKLVLYNEFPGYEAWFFAAKKNSQLIRQIIETYSLFTQLDLVELVQRFHDQDVYMNNVELYGSHLTIDMALSYTLQIKQLRLDQQKTLFSSRKTVYEHYNLWSLSGFLGPLIWPKGIAGWKFIQLDAQGFEERQYIVKFFIKMSGWFNSRIVAQLQYLENLFSQNGGQTFQQFLAKNPTQQQCIDTTFFVNGSVFYETLKSLPQIASGKIETISIQQRERWYKHCSQYHEQISTQDQILRIFLPQQSPLSIPFYKVHQKVNFDKGKSQTFIENVNDFLFERKGTFQYLFKCLLNFSLFSIAQIVIVKTLQKIWRKFKKNQNTASDQKHSKISSLVLFLFVMLSATFSAYQFTVVDYFGQRDDLPTIILVLISVFWMNNYVEKRIKNNEAFKTYYNLMAPFINFCTAYLTFCNTRKYKVTLIYCSIIIGLLGSCLLKLLHSLQTRKLKRNHLLFIFKKLSEKHVYQIGSVVLVTLMHFSPNFRYFTVDGKYLLSYLPIFLSYGILIVYFMVLIECIRTKVKLEIFNLLILGLFSLYLKGIILEKVKHIHNNVWKVTWYISIVCLYSMIYQQIGSSFVKTLNPNSQNRKRIITWLKYFAGNLFKLGIFYSGFVMEIYGKKLNVMNYSHGNLLLWLKEIMFSTLISVIIGVYVLLNGQQTQIAEIQALQSSEMDDFEPNAIESKLEFELSRGAH